MSQYPSKVVYAFSIDADGTVLSRAWILPDDYELPDRPPDQETILPSEVSNALLGVMDKAINL